MFDLRKPICFFALAALLITMLGACREKLEGGAACPALCPEQGLEVRDTTLFPFAFPSPVAIDSTILGFPPIGTELQLVIARRGDSLQTAAIARFDTLSSTIRIGVTDTSRRPITGIDSASLVIEVGETPIATSRVTIEVYDVDTTAADLDVGAIRPLFRPDRLIASASFAQDSLTGRLRIPLPTAFLASRVIGGQRVRLGIAVRSDASVQIRSLSTESGGPPVITYLARVANDTQTVAAATNSRGALRGLADFVVVLRSSQAPATLLVVGGLPSSRVYLRFVLPTEFLDSTTIVRATLVLTQIPSTAVDAADTIIVIPRLVRASSILDSDPGKASLLLGDPQTFFVPALRLVPGASGTRKFEIVNAVNRWKSEDPEEFTRALVLQAADEGNSAHSAIFYSSEAQDPALRPRLEITFIPIAGFGLP
ncbi:MAG: hypothetical protein H7Z74_05015 [Anaerolineae bacterium]|nr:hypothetical protein [Gemmatimonadaceae bacterium]